MLACPKASLLGGIEPDDVTEDGEIACHCLPVCTCMLPRCYCRTNRRLRHGAGRVMVVYDTRGARCGGDSAGGDFEGEEEKTSGCGETSGRKVEM